MVNLLKASCQELRDYMADIEKMTQASMQQVFSRYSEIATGGVYDDSNRFVSYLAKNGHIVQVVVPLEGRKIGKEGMKLVEFGEKLYVDFGKLYQAEDDIDISVSPSHREIYDLNTNKIIEERDWYLNSKGEVRGESITTFDDNENPKTITKKDGQGNVYSVVESSYDESNNLVQRIHKDGKGNVLYNEDALGNSGSKRELSAAQQKKLQDRLSQNG